ncbi:MAG: glycosyltransferase family 39 protein [Candidatus Altiarchaeota archaeon]
MDESQKDWRVTLLLVASVAVALLLRIPNLSSTPHWYWDEGYNMNYGWNLSHLRIQWFSIKYTFIPHPPLYFAVLAAMIKTFGYSLYAARLLNVLYSIITLLLIYLTASEVADRRTGAIASMLYAIYPAAAYWSRTAMINNQFSLLAMLSLYSLIAYARKGGRWWMLSCASAVAATLTAYMGLSIVAALLLYMLVREPVKMRKASLILVTPLLLFTASMLLIRGSYFTEDMAYQLNRFHLLSIKKLAAIPVLILFAANYRRLKPFLTNLFDSEVELMFDSREYFNEVFVPSCLLAINFLLAYKLVTPFSDDSVFSGGDYFWLGIIGLLFIGRFRVHVVLLYFLPLFITTILLGRSDHMLMQLYPFFAIGIAVLLVEYQKFLSRILSKWNIPSPAYVSILLLASPFAFTAYHDASAFIIGGVLREEDVSSAFSAAGYVNSIAGDEDLVLTTSNLAGMINAKTNIITQAFVYEGRGIAYYRANMTSDWFAYNTSIDRASYVVVPKGSLEWFEELGYDDLYSKIDGWPRIYENRIYMVYANPVSHDPTAPEDKPSPKH